MRNLCGLRILYDGQSRVSRVITSYDYSASGNYVNEDMSFNYTYDEVLGTLEMMTMSSVGVIGTVNPQYDKLGRMTGKTSVYIDQLATELEIFRNDLSLEYKQNGNNQSFLVSQYDSTVSLGNDQTQTTVSKYTYDSNNYITEIKDGNNVIQNKYYYDDLGQLIREDNRARNATYVYTYDNAGNITSKKTYAFTTGTPGTATSTVNYTYGDASWGDLLTKYGSTTITYDTIGSTELCFIMRIIKGGLS